MENKSVNLSLISENSRRWGEFRLAVVGQLLVCELGRGQLEAELRSLSAKKWNHPISGQSAVFGYSTIARWYYIARNNPEGRLRALSTTRSDTGNPWSLTNQVRSYLERQAKRHNSWSYTKHHQVLIRMMSERGWGVPPSYKSVSRYLQSLPSSQNRTSNVQLLKLQGLVGHLRRTLIVQSIVIRLLKVPEIRPKIVGSAFRFMRLGPHEKSYVLSRLQNYKSAGGSLPDFCAGVGISTSTIERWTAAYVQYGEAGLYLRTRRKFANRTNANETNLRILELFHNQPCTYGINRASWTGKSLADALHRTFRITISGRTASKYIRRAGYTMRRARQVLTSPDPDYREKVETLLQTLQTLRETEMLFFVDELGPLPVKKHGGRALVRKGEPFVVPQHQTPKGSIIMAAALSATTNQITWCFVPSKDSLAMIDLIEILFNQYRGKTRLYITWDAASWHDSISLVEWLDTFNQQTMKTGEGPLLALLPLPSCSQFLNVIESVFSAMKKAVIHHSDYQSDDEMKTAISRHFVERNVFFQENPKRAGKKIWEIDFFRDMEILRSGNYREW
jgi:transposase